jgi:hypothetical protein
MQPTRDDARQRLRDDPTRRLYAELYCFFLTFVFHDGNNHTRKAFTIAIVGVWAAIELGAAFGYATVPDQFFFLRVVVGVILGKMWEIEVNNFAGVEFGYGDDSNDSSNGGDNGGD